MIRLDMSPAWHWSLVLAVVVAVVVLIVRTYPRQLQSVSPRAARSLLLLRLAVALVLAFTMLRPSLQFVEPDSRPRLFAVVMDRTRSMSIGDAAGGKTRREALIATISANRRQLEDLGDNVEVRFFDFDRELVPLDLSQDELPSAEASGDQTAMGHVLENLLQEARNRQYSGAILMGDGAQRALSPFDLDPRRVARMLGDQGLPVYTVPFGASGGGENSVDISIDDLLVDRVVFENKAVIVRARVRLVGAANRQVTLRLKVEDRAGLTIGQSGPMVQPPSTGRTSPIRRISTTRNEDVRQFELSFVPTRPGEFIIAVEADGLPEEVRKTNNGRRSLISVRRGGIRVAYIDQPRPEIRSVQLLRSSEKIQLETHIVRPGRSGQAAGLPAELFQRGQHDVYILGNIPASVLGPEHLASLAARVREGAGLLMLGGFSAFGAGGYANTPLDALSPVAMSPAEFQDAGAIETDLHLMQDIRVIPTDAGLSHFIMRIADSGETNRSRWESLPPLEKANRIRPKNEFIDVLARDSDGNAMLLSADTGTGRLIAFAGDSTYFWFQFGHREVHQRFWQQMVYWLAHKEDDSDQPIWVQIEPRTYNAAAEVSLRYGARDEQGQPIPDAQFQVQVLAPGQRQVQLKPRRDIDAFSSRFAETAEAGDYWVEVNASRNGQSAGLPARARFLVDARDLELDDPAADPGLLEQIARLSGGARLTPERFGEAIDQLLSQPAAGGMARATVIDLWDNWYVLGVFVALVSSEWFLRKRLGLV